MDRKKEITGHLFAFITIFIWGTTFISTKILLKAISPIEILFLRFTIGFIVLLVVYPHRLKIKEKKQELYFASAGLCGVTLYYLLENIALTYTFASNVGVIISIAPFFTAIFAHLFLDGEKLKLPFFIGFAVAVIGIFLISFNGSSNLKLNPLGDILAVLAAVVWATQSVNLFNILFLGLGASALCFVTWNSAVKILGAVKTSVYIYMVPVITVVTSVIVLNETITGIAVFGIVLALVGLFISEIKTSAKKKELKE